MMSWKIKCDEWDSALQSGREEFEIKSASSKTVQAEKRGAVAREMVTNQTFAVVERNMLDGDVFGAHISFTIRQR